MLLNIPMALLENLIIQVLLHQNLNEFSTNIIIIMCAILFTGQTIDIRANPSTNNFDCMVKDTSPR